MVMNKRPGILYVKQRSIKNQYYNFSRTYLKICMSNDIVPAGSVIVLCSYSYSLRDVASQREYHLSCTSLFLSLTKRIDKQH